MSSHDEYSSDEEDVTTQKSDVYLGFTDVAFAEEEETPTIEETFIGGQPIWPHPDSVPAKELLQCDNCHKEMALLLQAFAPIDSKPYDRVIYIFGCKDTVKCSGKKGSVKAIRGVNKDPVKIAEIKRAQEEETQRLLDEKLRLEDKKKLQIEMTKDLFDATKPTTLNPFGASSNPFGSSSVNPFGKPADVPFARKEDSAIEEPEPKAKESYALASRKNAPKKEKKEAAGELPEYPGYFVYVEQEKFKKVTLEPELEKYKHLIEQNDTEDTAAPGSDSSSMLNPETSKIASMLNDKYFENFSSIVGHNSTQVLRYDLGGKPLLYSGKDDVAKVFLTNTIPDPSFNPSSHRQFELQLMPKAIIDLEQQDSKTVADILGGMSWGTIIVATDVEDGVLELDENHVGYVQEYCGVQWEESV